MNSQLVKHKRTAASRRVVHLCGLTHTHKETSRYTLITYKLMLIKTSLTIEEAKVGNPR